jgi:hypothetical protein
VGTGEAEETRQKSGTRETEGKREAERSGETEVTLFGTWKEQIS